MKKYLILMAVLMSAFFVSVTAYASNGWTIDNPGTGVAEICDCNSLGGKALHIENTDGDDITVSHLITGTGTVRSNYRVTFYASGTYDEEKIMVGVGNKTTGSNPDVITFMPLSHEKVEKSDAGDGWTKYTYIFRGNVANNAVFRFVVSAGNESVYIDNASIVFENATDDAFTYVGRGLLAEGDFEDAVTAETGFPIEDYGWTTNIPTVTGTPAADDTVEAIARVVEEDNGNRMLYVKYNQSLWTTGGFKLSKTIEKTGWESFYVSFKIKGAFAPGSVEVGGHYADKYRKLVNNPNSNCTVENPYGDYVTAEQLEGGWTKYTVSTYGEGTEFIIKFDDNCLGVYIDDFEVVTEAGVTKQVPNGNFDSIDYKPEKVFAEAWEAENVDETAFAQREQTKDGYAIYLTSDSFDDKAGFYQVIDGVVPGEMYTVNFDARTLFEASGMKVGFGDSFDMIDGQVLSGIGNESYSLTLTALTNKLVFVTNGQCRGVWIDNVSVTDADGNELIVNGDFEIKTQPPVYSVKNVKLMNGDTEAELGQGSYTVTADVENNFGDDGMEFTMIVSHDRGGEMIKYAIDSVTLDPNGEDGEATALECSIDLSDYAEGDALEVYIWDNVTDMNPLISFSTFN